MMDIVSLGALAVAWALTAPEDDDDGFTCGRCDEDKPPRMDRGGLCVTCNLKRGTERARGTDE